MEKRYTLPVAIALVVGTVIGSGVFFKAEAVLTKTGGNLSVGILAFIIMVVVMIISACPFGVVAQSHEGVEGLVGYASASCGKVMPVLAIRCSLFLVFAAIYSHQMNVVYYLIVFVVIEIIGACFKGGKKA